jgi:hypothetical protein
MIKSIEEKMGQPMEINLTGPEGNVFNLIGVGGRLCKLLNINQDKFVREMMSGDYDNAVNTFEKYFGDYVILYK